MLISFDQCSIRCRHCGSRDAVLSCERWSDGLFYADVHCPACGASYLPGG
ncbi:MAG: hypothetical protein AB1665_06135 [Candidatus Thermoplasmatota archaeon]